MQPFYPHIAPLQVSTTAGSNTIEFLDATPDKSWIGRFVFLGEWYKIIYVSANGVVTVHKNVQSETVYTTGIVVMNDLLIEGEGLELTTLDIDYTPLMSI